MRKIQLICFIIILAFFAAQEALAIPAFARKYRMSCTTCHAPVPKLKPYGAAFAANGFVLSDKESPRYFEDTGDNLLSLIRNFPIAARLEGYLTWDSDKQDNTADFKSPWLIKLMSGGALSDNISYYFYFYMNEKGEVAGVEDAYLMYNNFFGIDLDMYIGQFQVSDPLFKRELRLTLEDYRVYTIKPGLSNVNLAYDRGLMITYGTDFGTDAVLEVLNGSGLNQAGDNGLFDTDEYKNLAGRLSQDIGDFLRIGVFGYFGKERMANDSAVSSVNEINMYGPDLTLTLGETLELNFQYIQRKDSKVVMSESASAPVKEIISKGIMSELIYYPEGYMGRWYGAALFNYIDSEDKSLNYKSIGGHIGYLLRRNIRLVGEYTANYTNADNIFSKVSIGLVSAF